ncbi:MAG: hypothetical protein QW619_04635 [Candidatus Bathyarchaeia archaeon]
MSALRCWKRMVNPVEIAEKIMLEFAYETGLSSSLKPRRYLWTDAFAVCNFLELYRRKSDLRYLQLALKLVDQVHYILGRHREDDLRRGWISGLSEEDGYEHPTIGGLRIGKPLPERRPEEPYDEILEWERDGQYYHYLTKWMHALNMVSRATGDIKYKVWAIELAKTAHRAFIYMAPDGRRRIYWKMSIDLSRPLVPLMGLHDPLDGLITYMNLSIDAPKEPNLNLLSEIMELEEICLGMDWTTNDPLGVGELLWSAYFLAKIILYGKPDKMSLLADILNTALLSLELSLATRFLRLPAGMRLAFREAGLSIGLKAAERLLKLVESNRILRDNSEVYSLVRSVVGYRWISEEIEKFWLNQLNMESRAWKEHKDINMVMLATSLLPDGFLGVY